MYHGKSQRTALENGEMAEYQISSFLGFDVDRHGTVDLELHKPYEIKSCQTCIKGGRSGRFWLRPEQHNELLDREGYYIFAVTEAGKVVKTCIKAADRVCGRMEKPITPAWVSVWRR